MLNTIFYLIYKQRKYVFYTYRAIENKIIIVELKHRFNK